MMSKVSAKAVAEIYAVLDKIGCLGADRSAGYLRAAYSDEETAAMRLIEKYAVECGAFARWDPIGNLFLEWPGAGNNFLEAASHIDTVPRGGNFDGAAGVVAGLLAIRAIKNSGKATNVGFRLRIWRAEESGTFNILYGGSRGAFGIFDADSLLFKFRGKTYKEAMLSQNADPEHLISKKRSISQEEADGILAHFELHIEQGNLLEVGNKNIGVVTSIRAPKRYRILLHGEFNHSGATPMGKEYRKDVNLAMAYIQVELDKLCSAHRLEGLDVVQTVGVINSNLEFNEANPTLYSNAIPVISGFGYFTLDIRSNLLNTLTTYSQEAEKVIETVCGDFGVSYEISLLSSGKPLEQLDENIQSVLLKSAEALGLSAIKMASGAGHDAAIVGAQKKTDGSNIPVAMIFIPCRKGKSHTPEEFTTFESIADGANVMARAMMQIDSLVG